MTTTRNELDQLNHALHCMQPLQFACQRDNERVLVHLDDYVEMPESGHWIGDWWYDYFSIQLQNDIWTVRSKYPMEKAELHFMANTVKLWVMGSNISGEQSNAWITLVEYNCTLDHDNIDQAIKEGKATESLEYVKRTLEDCLNANCPDKDRMAKSIEIIDQYKTSVLANLRGDEQSWEI